jgi:SAM-dependent methyltransferase
MSVWGELFNDPVMQDRQPNPELMALLPGIHAAGCRRVLDAGCGVGRHLLPLAQTGFLVWGVDNDPQVLRLLQTRLANLPAPAAGPFLARADLSRLPFASGVFDLAVSTNVINHGYAATFREYCRELDRILRPGGRLFILASPREVTPHVTLPGTRELEPGTLVDIATPDGGMVHHFPTVEELRAQFPGYHVQRCQSLRVPIPFMGNVELPQLIFWGAKRDQTKG